MSRIAESHSRKTGSRPRSKKRVFARSGWRAWFSANKRSVITLLVVAIVVSLSWGNVDMGEVHRQARTVPLHTVRSMIALVGGGRLFFCPATFEMGYFLPDFGLHLPGELF